LSGLSRQQGPVAPGELPHGVKAPPLRNPYVACGMPTEPISRAVNWSCTCLALEFISTITPESFLPKLAFSFARRSKASFAASQSEPITSDRACVCGVPNWSDHGKWARSDGRVFGRLRQRPSLACGGASGQVNAGDRVRAHWLAIVKFKSRPECPDETVFRHLFGFDHLPLRRQLGIDTIKRVPHRYPSIARYICNEAGVRGRPDGGQRYAADAALMINQTAFNRTQAVGSSLQRPLTGRWQHGFRDHCQSAAAAHSWAPVF